MFVIEIRFLPADRRYMMRRIDVRKSEVLWVIKEREQQIEQSHQPENLDQAFNVSSAKTRLENSDIKDCIQSGSPPFSYCVVNNISIFILQLSKMAS